MITCNKFFSALFLFAFLLIGSCTTLAQERQRGYTADEFEKSYDLKLPAVSAQHLDSLKELRLYQERNVKQSASQIEKLKELQKMNIASLRQVENAEVELIKAKALLDETDKQIAEASKIFEQELSNAAHMRLLADDLALTWISIKASYLKAIRQSFPQYNYITVHLLRTGRNLALVARHPRFSRRTFDVGKPAHLIERWIKQNRQNLIKGLVIEVGLMSADRISDSRTLKVE
jgi:hypothetical protein